MRRRLDAELVRRGLVSSLDRGREAIEAGQVSVGGAPASTAARLVAPDESVALAAPPARFVGRGGEKLAGALERFSIDVCGLRVLDAGSSTGGFTDCALQAGAATVVAVDVGRGQLHNKLMNDPRVEVHERTNIRHVAPGSLGAPADVVVADLSFISLRTVAPALLQLCRPGAELVWLIKPQFEAERSEVRAGAGVITEPEVWRRVLMEVCAAIRVLGATIMEVMASPLRGADGNVEFLVHGVAGHQLTTSGSHPAGDLATLVANAVEEARQL